MAKHCQTRGPAVLVVLADPQPLAVVRTGACQCVEVCRADCRGAGGGQEFGRALLVAFGSVCCCMRLASADHTWPTPPGGRLADWAKVPSARPASNIRTINEVPQAPQDPRSGAASGRPRDEFPNNYVGDLVRTARGWVVVPPTACPQYGHPISDPGWSVSAPWCLAEHRHMAWRCWCGATVYAPRLGPRCQIRDIGPVSPYEEDQRRASRG